MWFVTEVVAVTIIELLEMVEIDEDHGEGRGKDQGILRFSLGAGGESREAAAIRLSIRAIE